MKASRLATAITAAAACAAIGLIVASCSNSSGSPVAPGVTSNLAANTSPEPSPDPTPEDSLHTAERQALLERAWLKLERGQQALLALRADCITAKEALSVDTEVTVSVVVPGLSTDVRVTRAEFESFVRPRLSETLGRAPAGLAARHARLLSSLGLGEEGPLPPADEIVASMRLDKKYRGAVRFVLLEDVGRPYVDEVPADALRSALERTGAAPAMGG